MCSMMVLLNTTATDCKRWLLAPDKALGLSVLETLNPLALLDNPPERLAAEGSGIQIGL